MSKHLIECPLLQLYEYNIEKLQKLMQYESYISYFYTDGNYIGFEVYILYGWRFPCEKVYIASKRNERFNIFGVVDHQKHCVSFIITESITTDKDLRFIDVFLFCVHKNIFVILVNYIVYCNHKIKKLKTVRERRYLFLFYLTTYFLHLNIEGEFDNLAPIFCKFRYSFL